MFLKRLEVTGFKSFAGRTVLDFDKTTQVAAIVGPNGSGKSNIADAVRWVLGEQSYKSLRSKKSEDVIFSGSSAKSKASFAKVSMVLDNSDKKAPIDFTEVQISRAVYRDGSSEYLLAGKKARLLDVAELLAKSGFGQSTYTVLGQGMIDSMLFYGPAERKVLFDEAAGVRAYEIKREQTLKKLEDTNTNLIRIKDILSELSPRANVLRKQSEKAKAKDQIKASLLEKQKVYFSTIWDRLGQKEKALRNDLDKVFAEENKITAEIERLNLKFTEIVNAEKGESSETESLREKVEKLEDKREEIRQKIFTLKAKIEFSLSGLSKKEIDERVGAEKEKIASLSLDELVVQKKNIEKRLNALDVEGLRASVRRLDGERDLLREEIFKLRAQIEVGQSGPTKEEIENKILTLEEELSQLNVDTLQKSKNELEKEVPKTEGAISNLDKEIEQCRISIQEMTKELTRFDFGVVGEKLSAILYLQNDFVLKIQGAKKLEEVADAVHAGKQIAERLRELRKQIGDVKEGKMSGMAEVQEKLQNLVSEKEELSKRLNTAKSELWKIEFEIKKSSDKKFEIEKELGKLTSLKPVERNNKDSLEKKINENLAKITGLEADISKLKQALSEESTLLSEKTNLEYEIRREEDKKAQLEREIERLNNLKPVENKEKKQLEKQIAEHEGEITKLNSEIQAINQKINNRARDFENQGKELTSVKDSIAEKQALISEYTREGTEIRVELGKIEARRQDLKEEIQREMGSESLLADATVVPELDDEKARTEIERLKNKLYSIGEIDPEVEQEFIEVSERLTFMSSQTEDLDKAKADLERLLGELDIKIKKQFEGSFNEISKKFTHFFDILFSGGEAKLELVKTKDEEEKESFGIEITAIPPGKRVKSLSALSGGERTMTSLALLFAILSVNPSPFCVLDEVDAALDETNTKKFLKIISELSSKTQFIFITHNRETMKSAGVIFGVTMDDSHASRLLSIRLEEALTTTKK